MSICLALHVDPLPLQVLNLDFCTLSELPPSLGQLTALTTLDVEGNPYLGESYRDSTAEIPQAFPCELSGLQALKYINLNSCGLTQIPEVSAVIQSNMLCFVTQDCCYLKTLQNPATCYASMYCQYVMETLCSG